MTNRVRWIAWSLFFVAWTCALLSSGPVDLADEFIPEEGMFLSFKFTHVAGYALLTGLTGWLGVPSRSRRLVILALALHGASTELGQTFVPRRTPSLRDIGFDCLGVAVGLALTWKWWFVRPELVETEPVAAADAKTIPRQTTA